MASGGGNENKIKIHHYFDMVVVHSLAVVVYLNSIGDKIIEDPEKYYYDKPNSFSIYSTIWALSK